MAYSGRSVLNVYSDDSMVDSPATFVHLDWRGQLREEVFDVNTRALFVVRKDLSRCLALNSLHGFGGLRVPN